MKKLIFLILFFIPLFVNAQTEVTAIDSNQVETAGCVRYLVRKIDSIRIAVNAHTAANYLIGTDTSSLHTRISVLESAGYLIGTDTVSLDNRISVLEDAGYLTGTDTVSIDTRISALEDAGYLTADQTVAGFGLDETNNELDVDTTNDIASKISVNNLTSRVGANESNISTNISNIEGAITNVNSNTSRLAEIENDTANWQTAYGWGDHSVEGYITTYTDSTSAGFGLDETNNALSVDTTNDVASKIRVDTLAADITTNAGNISTLTAEVNNLQRISDSSHVKINFVPTPSITPVEGDVYYDSDNNLLLLYNGSGYDTLNTAGSGYSGNNGAGLLYSPLEFKIGTTTNAPTAGDSILENTSFYQKYLRVYRDGLLLSRDTLDGMELNDSALTVHPPFATGEQFIIDILDTDGLSSVTLTEDVATVVDTLGFDFTIGGSLTSSGIQSTTDFRFTKDTAESTGYIDTIWVYMITEASTDSIKVAIYDDDTDYPGDLLGQSINTQANRNALGWYPVALTSQVNITSTSKYWIGVLYDGNNPSNVYYISDGLGRSVYGNGTWDTLPSTISSGFSSSTSRYLFYAEIKD